MAAKTFLQLVQRAYGLASLQGSVATVTAPGFVSTLQSAISEKWSDIQTDQTKNFTFMEGVQLFDTVPTKHTYSPSDMFGIDVDLYGKFMQVCYRRATPLSYKPLSTIADSLQHDVPKEPLLYCNDKADGSLIINTPDAVYTLKLDYKKATQELTADQQVFSGPSDVELAVIYGGLMKFAAVIGDNNLLTVASHGWDDMYPAMCSAYNRVIKTVAPHFII